MINKAHRLTRVEIDGIKKFPKKTREGGLLALYEKSKKNQLKISVVVTKKISPLAVKRNKHKREVVSRIVELLSKYSEKPLNIIFYPSKQFLNQSFEKMTTSLSNIIESCLKNTS